MTKERIAKNDDVAQRTASDGSKVLDMNELGATGLRRFSGFIYDEFLPELVGWKGVAVYKEMSHNEPTIVAILFAIKMLIRRVKWFVDAASDEKGDREAAEFLETCMDDMAMTWGDVINEILTMLEYGFSVHEIVYKRRIGDVEDPRMRSKYCDGRIGWRRLSIRSQDTIYRWHFDDNGGITGVEQIAPPHYKNTLIPVEKMLLFRTTVEKNNPEGLSLLRGAYRPWYMKRSIENIEGIGIERDLAGLPMAFVPPELLSRNASASQQNLLAAIKNMTVNVRRNEQEGMVFPLEYDEAGHQLYDFKLLSTGGSRQFDTNTVINRYDHRIAMTMLADFMLMGQEKVGSFALATSKTSLFTTSLGAFLDMVCEVFNRYAIPRLFALNDFDLSDFPKLNHGDIGSVDLAELGTYLSQLTAAGMPLFPNPEVEKHFLEVAGIPSGWIDEQSEEHIAIENPLQGGSDDPNTETRTSDVPSPTAEPVLPGADPASSEIPAAVEEKVAAVTLNGAQIASVLDLLQQVALGAVPRDSAVNLLMVAFGMAKEGAEGIIGQIGPGSGAILPGTSPALTSDDAAPTEDDVLNAALN